MMPESKVKCPHCQSINKFKVEPIEVEDYRFKLLAIMCAECNTVINFIEVNNIGEMLETIRTHFKIK